MKPVRILFVCHGNICRSPMAEFVLRDMANRRGLGDRVIVASAATSGEEIGNPVYPEARRILSRHGISCQGKVSRRLTRGDYDRYDLFLGMDQANLRNMRAIMGGDPDGKIRLLGDYAKLRRDIADPWYTRDFESTWRDVCAGCEALLTEIAEGGGTSL